MSAVQPSAVTADDVVVEGCDVCIVGAGVAGLNALFLARSQASVSLDGQPIDHRLPHRVLLREAVQQNDDRAIGRPGIDYVEHELAAAKLFHRLTISARTPLVTLVGDD